MGHMHRYRTIFENRCLLSHLLINSGSILQKGSASLLMNASLEDLDPVKELRLLF